MLNVLYKGGPLMYVDSWTMINMCNITQESRLSGRLQPVNVSANVIPLCTGVQPVAGVPYIWPHN